MPSKPRDETKATKRWSKKLKDVKGRLTNRGEPQVEEVAAPEPPDTPIHKQYATQQREAARRQAELGFTSTDNLSGRATPSTSYWSSATATPSVESPQRNLDGSTPGTQSTSPYRSRIESGSIWKNEHEIDGQPVTQPSSDTSRGTLTRSPPQVTSTHSDAPPRLMVELPSERMIDTEPVEMPVEEPKPTETNQEPEEAMRSQTGNTSGRDSPLATRHRNESYSERTGGLPSSPDQHKAGPSQPPMDPARAAATLAYQAQTSTATQRKAVGSTTGNPPYPTAQNDAVPPPLVPPRGASVRPEVVRSEAVRSDTVRSEGVRPDAIRSVRSDAIRSEVARSEVARSEAARSEAARSEAARLEATRSETARLEASRSEAVRPDPPINQDHTPDERDRRSDPARETDPFNYIIDDDDDDNDDQWSHQSTEQHVESEERRGTGLRDRFRRNGGTQKQHQTLQKPGGQNSSLDDWSRKLKAFQKQHKVPKDPYVDQLGTVLQWANKELERRKQAVEAKDQQIKSYSGSVGKLKDEIARLNSSVENRNRQIHQLQDDWTKAENARQKAAAERDSIQTHARGLKDTLKSTQKKLEAAEQEYQIAVGERNTAQQESAMYQKHYEQTTTELQKVNSNLNRVVGERNKARTECNGYWETAQQKELELEDALKINKQLDHSLTTTTNERDAYKQSSDTALARCLALEKEKREEIAKTQAIYSRQISTLNENSKKKQEELEGTITDMALSHQRVVEEMTAEHEAEIARRDAEAKNLEERFRAKLRADTTKLQNELTAAHKRMASYSNMDDYVATPDDEFRSNFLHIAQRINNLNYWVPRPNNYSFDPELDPDSFLTRNAEQGGRNWPKFVRHVCWRIIMQGFFDRPLGFGALGCQGSDGFDAMDHLFQVFAVTDTKGSRGLILPNTKEMNSWRADFFGKLLKKWRQGSASDDYYLRFFQANVQLVTNDLLASLQRASGSRLDPQASGEIAEFVEGLGTLALEMASQRAQIYLDSCEHGESANVDRFKDEAGMGSGSATVDLMIQPCIRRVGDGRNDFRAERVIVKGDFVSVKAGY
ncbi:uncharacterized protein NECHADRAFT_74084 [Fusarium vanettenii 77-13-4]|uniref:Uncharacterized protein n=1 Tax=Fusarium vanettenii (strain ATCC MYA-4622 / CBS 123669 / FGSC 9596 / NRRL 45880 / 77-13-4) TaxID=660122 RepID=C7YVU9_FUSV7|nr:uncharacterized protein NECHADRAFT_74084 [Fusarium vanettenii 77-13-4]EEU44065.1 hypothetical protein NECHADRAFT_74084 [Fusarium vanettenii 77-13-4]